VTARGASILQQYAQAVLYFNPRLDPADASRIAQSIIVYSNHYGLDARLVMAVVAVESNFNANAVSRVGAMGLGQLMPGTASGLGVSDPWSPEQNIEGATRLLSGHIANMAAKAPTVEAIKLALACYNAGAGAVKKHNGIPPYRETQNYVKKVTRLYYQMCGQSPPDE
jgi:soluble lytic murein transglycosylase-like protein